jgi:hypothetical protein
MNYQIGQRVYLPYEREYGKITNIQYYNTPGEYQLLNNINIDVILDDGTEVSITAKHLYYK